MQLSCKFVATFELLGASRREAWRGPRTFTNLYNACPTWLELAHKKLGEAVFAELRSSL